MIYCFGDSWGHGSELDLSYEIPFVNILSNKTNIEFKNLSGEGSALGKITHDIFCSETKFKSDDFVIVIIPPDIRWYFEDKHGGISSLFIPSQFYFDSNPDLDDLHVKELHHYMETATNKKTWFSYHHSLFIFSLQEYFKKINVEFIFVHNYGKITLYKEFKNLIDKENFLNFNRSLTSLLTNQFDIDLIGKKLDKVGKDILIGKYFEGNGTHPTQLGHEKISELIYENKKFQKWYQSITNGVN
jgi:hypothetical protein